MVRHTALWVLWEIEKYSLNTIHFPCVIWIIFKENIDWLPVVKSVIQLPVPESAKHKGSKDFFQSGYLGVQNRGKILRSVQLILIMNNVLNTKDSDNVLMRVPCALLTMMSWCDTQGTDRRVKKVHEPLAVISSYLMNLNYFNTFSSCLSFS